MTILTIETDSLPVVTDPQILGGTTVFAGTRVPVRTLFDYIEDGFSLDEFLENFPTVRREQAIALVDAAGSTLSRAAMNR